MTNRSRMPKSRSGALKTITLRLEFGFDHSLGLGHWNLDIIHGSFQKAVVAGIGIYAPTTRGAVLAHLIQHIVLRQARRSAPGQAMPVEARTLGRPEHVIEHERVHRHQYRGRRGARARGIRADRLVVKCACQREERRGCNTVGIVERLPSLYLPAPRARFEYEADASVQKVPCPEVVGPTPK